MALSKSLHCNAKEVLHGYKNNKCRLCDEMFCCPKCRMRHEGSTHEVNVECSLCIYGFVVMRQVNSDDLTKHIIDKHLLPISRCAYCETIIAANTFLNHDNSLCTLTNFTDEEIKQIWTKLPENVRKEMLLPCNTKNSIQEAKSVIKEVTKNAIEGSTDVEEQHYDSPILNSLKPQQLFGEGGFTNSTPVLGLPNPSNLETVETQTKPNNLSSNNNTMAILDDTSKKRKVQFDVTPQPVITKTPSSFQGVIKKSSFKKIKNKTEGGISDANTELIKDAKHEQMQNVDKCLNVDKESLPKERITVPVKPIQRDVSTVSNMESVNQLSLDASEDCRWMTAMEYLPELDIEKFKFDETSKASDILDSGTNIVHIIDLQTQLPSMTQEFISNESTNFDAMKTALNLWTKCKSKLLQLTRPSVKRLRSELDVSLEETQEISTPVNECKRRRFLECRRPIHYYIKPQVNRDIKKVNKSIQTSLY